MLVSRTRVAAAAAIGVLLTPNLAVNQVARGKDTTAAAQVSRDTAPRTNPPPVLASFQSSVLSGGAINELNIKIQSSRLVDLPTGKIEWVPQLGAETRQCSPEGRTGSISILSKNPDRDDDNKTVLAVFVPAPRCKWPPTQLAKITITGNVVEGDRTKTSPQSLFDAVVPVSVFWFPFVVTAAVIALIYPGCAIGVWFLRRRRYRKEMLDAAQKGELPLHQPPSLFAALDPIQITANAYGRGSVAKMQIFLFTLIVFGVLLFYQLRSAIIANMSTDVLQLLGISAVGAAGGKIAYIYKRRLSLENWAWLRRRGWLPPGGDVAKRAKWSDLILDSDTREFDPYSFQMALFSVVVAVALIRTASCANCSTGLATFRIPAELLALLGLSQAVFIGGKAIEKSAYLELGTQLDDVRKQESEFQQASMKPDPATADQKRQAFKASAVQAAEMFWDTYGEQLGKKPAAIENIDEIEPDLH